MRIVIDDAGRRVFAQPKAMILAHRIEELAGALQEVRARLAQGCHVAGWLSYELGFGFEQRLMALMPKTKGPLLKLGVYSAPEPRIAEPRGRAYAGPLVPEWDEEAYGRRFAIAKAYIAAGDIYQANLSFRARFRFFGDPFSLYEDLREKSRAGHCAFIEDGERAILSLSPELFFDLDAKGRLTARPMKGTRARFGNDEGERAALRESTKDRAENLMIVDLIRNDLSRIAQAGTVSTSRLFEIETYPSLHTMVSTIVAQTRPQLDPGDLLRALFPCGSVTGAPKIRAMEILRELESSPREAYCGAIGYFAPDGSARFNVAIRTLTIIGNLGEIGLGGGVVQDSLARSEYRECLLKGRFFEGQRKPLALIETLRWDKAFLRLNSHLDRMENSARVFGFPFSRAKAQALLQEAVLGAQSPLRLRLSLDERGTHQACVSALDPNPDFWTYRVSAHRVFSGDVFSAHKTSWRELYDSEPARLGCDEVIFVNERGELSEASRSNIFVSCGDLLLTPPLSCGVLDGRLRAELIGQGRAREERLTLKDLDKEVYFGNSLRGLIRGVRL